MACAFSVYGFLFVKLLTTKRPLLKFVGSGLRIRESHSDPRDLANPTRECAQNYRRAPDYSSNLCPPKI